MSEVEMEPGQVAFDQGLFEAFLRAKEGKATAKQRKVLGQYQWTIFNRHEQVVENVAFEDLVARKAWDLVVNYPWVLRPADAPTVEPRPPRKRRPGKKAVNAAMVASLSGAATEEDLKVLEAAKVPTSRELRKQESLEAMQQADPFNRDRAWISDALTQCPLPLIRPTGMEAQKIIREVRTGNGVLSVVYTATGLQCIPYGKDAYLLDVLISEARKRGERLVSFETAIEIMRLAGFDVGGHDYKLFKEALERIGGLHISVIRKGVGKGNYRVVKIQSLDIPSQDDVRRELSGQKRLLQYAFEFSEEFYEDFMKYYTVIPQNLLDGFAGAPTEYAIARWIYRRATKAQSAAYIPLEELHKEIAPSDTNTRRFRGKFEMVVQTLQLHWPELFALLKPKRVKRKGSEALVGFQLLKPVPSLIEDRRPKAIGKVGTDLKADSRCSPEGD